MSIDYFLIVGLLRLLAWDRVQQPNSHPKAKHHQRV